MSEQLQTTMTVDVITDHLSRVKARITDTTHPADRKALEDAISILSALQDEGVGSPAEVHDLLHDYRLQAKELKALRERHETASKPVRSDGVWHCPNCNHRIQPNHSYCHWCGKKIGGW